MDDTTRQKWVNSSSHTSLIALKTSEPSHDKANKMAVRKAKTQISLGIHPVWLECSLCAEWVAKDPSFIRADSEDSDQTGLMPKLIWVFAGRTCICFVLPWGGSSNLVLHYLSLNKQCCQTELSARTKFKRWNSYVERLYLERSHPNKINF